ncbi:MAG: PD-(D/E)XK nuclease family protein [Bacteroidales bacterium]
MRTITFLEDIKNRILAYDLKEGNLTVILPSHRLERYLTLALEKEADKNKDTSCWMPRFVTLDKFIYDLSETQPINSIELSLMLYKVYREVYATSEEASRSYDDFCEWGKMLIGDFNQLDSQLSSVEEVLAYSAEEKRIGSWMLNIDKDHVLQSSYLKFYRNLWPIYVFLTQCLKEKRKAYPGLASRWAYEKLIEKAEYPSSKEQFLFFGFNALTKAEQGIIRLLIKNGQAEIYWDADVYYMEDPDQEAGFFLRQYRKDPYLGKHLGEEYLSDFIRKPKKIEIIEAAQTVGQAKLAAIYLEKLENKADTVLVLNDENLLLPLMNSIPESIACNVSVGSKLGGTMAASLLSICLLAKEEVEQSSFLQEEISVDKIVDLWKNPLFKFFFENKQDWHRIHWQKFAKSNKSKFNKTDFLSLFHGQTLAVAKSLADFIFAKESVYKNLENIIEIFSMYLYPIKEDISLLERAYIEKMVDLWEEYKVVLQSYTEIPIGFKSFKKWMIEMSSSIEITYKGNPQAEVQVMGMLETRSLPFKNIFLLSVNEDQLPQKIQDHSFLLHSVKKHCGIPLETEQTAMQAYYFYRLLQGAEKVFLFYSSSQVDERAKEKSRFLLQIENELSSQIQMGENYPFMVKNRAGDRTLNRICKNERIIGEVKKYLLERGLSFSALSTYIVCPIHFYYQYVLNLKKEDSLGDEFGLDKKGSVFHLVMEYFFNGKNIQTKHIECVEDRRKKVLSEKDIEDLKKLSLDLIKEAMQNIFPGGEYGHGENFLAYHEIILWLHHYLELLKKEIGGSNGIKKEMIVWKCESEDVSSVFPDILSGNRIKLSAKIDRIDSYDGVKRIIDYKTGQVDDKSLEINTYEDLKDPQKAKALQLLLYGFLYVHRYGGEYPSCGIYAVKKPTSGALILHGDFLENKTAENLTMEMKAFLREWVEEMVDINRPFERSSDEKGCKYCDFSAFCAHTF